MVANANQTNDGVKTTAYEYDPESLPASPGTKWVHINALFDGAHVSFGKKADAAVEGGATNGTLIALIKGVQKALGINTDAAVNTGNGYINGILKAIRDNLRTGTPGDATSVVVSSGNVAAASAVAAMPATASKTNYVTGIIVTGAGATAASVIQVTLAGLIGGVTATYIMAIPAGVTAAVNPLAIRFDPPIPANAANAAITLTAPSFGAGNTNACAVITGYRI